MDSNQPVIGLDLGQVSDSSALCVLTSEQNYAKQPHYTLRQLHRFPLGTKYTEIVSKMHGLFVHKSLEDAALVVDQSGVGRPVVDQMRASGLYPIGVTITGGSKETQDDETGDFHVPKAALVSGLQVLLQTKRVTVPKDLANGYLLLEELHAFQIKLLPGGGMRFGAREGKHDDIVLAVALAAWYSMKLNGDQFGDPIPVEKTPWDLEMERRMDHKQARQLEEEQLEQDFFGSDLDD